MPALERSSNPLARVCTWAVRTYLCVLLTGCGSHRPALITFGTAAQQPAPAKETTSPIADNQGKPAKKEKPAKATKKEPAKSPAVAPVEETHLFLGDERTAFQSCVKVLRNAGYTIDDTDTQEGVIQASFLTHEQVGSIGDQDRADDGPSRGWRIGVLALTGAALLIGGIVTVTQGLQGQLSEDAVEQRVGAGLAMMDMASSIEIPPVSVYEYQVAIQLLPMENNTTQIRVLLDGVEKQEGKVVREGEVRAPEFLAWFHAALDHSVNPEPEEHLHHLLSTR